MSATETIVAEALLADAVATPWITARAIVERSPATYWLATVHPDGRPDVRPVLAVWVTGDVFFCAGPATRKARNLALDARCTLTVEWEPLDLVIEGTATKTSDQTTLEQVAAAYATTYDWRVTVRDGAFHDVEGAPTAGPPPYEVYEVTPTTALGFGTDESFVPTRWRFRTDG